MLNCSATVSANDVTRLDLSDVTDNNRVVDIRKFVAPAFVERRFKGPDVDSLKDLEEVSS